VIDRLRLQNFKAFQTADVAFAPFTLLSGVNAVGKSTVMQALAVLRQSEESDMLRPGGGMLLNGDYAEIGTGADLLHDDFVADELGRPVVAVSLVAEGVTASWRVVVQGSAEREADVLDWEQCDSPPLNVSLFGNGFQYLRADRITPAVTYPKSYDVAVRRNSLGARGEHTVNFLRVNAESAVPDALHRPGSTGSSLLRQTEAWLQDVCPGVNLEAVGVSGADLVRLSYGFFGQAGVSSSEIRYRPTNVGFGLTYVLPLVVACLSAGPGSLLLLENPEAHLHPHGQTAMTELIARTAAAGAQVIVETHSDHVLNGVRLAVKRGILTGAQTAVHYVDRESSREPRERDRLPAVRIQSPSIGDDGMLSTWPEGFFDEWENSLDKLLDGEDD
jgi:predicted ATPase